MSRRAAVLFVLASVAWGVPYGLAALTLDDLQPIVTVFGRALLAVLVLAPVVLRRGGFGAFRGRVRQLAWLSLFDLTAPTLLVTLGIKTLPSSVAGTLVAAVPLIIAVLAWRLDAGERAGGSRLAGLVLGIVGVGLLLGFQVGHDAAALLGGALVLAGAASYASGALYYKRHFAADRPLDVVAAALVVCVVMTAVPAALALPDHAPSLRSGIALAVLGVGCTGGGYVAFYALIGLIGAGRAAVITYVAPAIAVLAGVTLLGEPLTAATLAGLLLVLAGSYLGTGGRPPGRWLSPRGRVRPARGGPPRAPGRRLDLARRPAAP